VTTSEDGHGVGRHRLGDAEEEHSGQLLRLNNGARRLRTGCDGGRVLHPQQTVQRVPHVLQVDGDA
jgi:hypothetical protein